MLGFTLVLVLLNLAQGDLDYNTQSLQQERWLLNEKSKLTRESIALLDAQVNYQVSALPGKINQAMEDITSGIQTTNQQYGGIVTAIAVGRLFRIFAGTVADTMITAGDVLATVVGPSLLSASFAASRVARIMNPAFGCKLNAYQSVLAQYGVLTSLRETYSSLSSPGPGQYTNSIPTYGGSNTLQPHAGELLGPGLQPCVLKHNARDLGSELRNSLSCVLDGSTGSSKALDRCISLLVDGVNRRLDLTQQLIDIMARMQLVNQKLNYV
eukprot:TRINITY_DN16886_c0_g1_i1.p1 TRINITY_DN16886_c0_g1~~TRINITY_DN16886_c0_g1_i1.p1  ORF type:complete len:269 (-),score=61.41 TRINITY_DN16886_c0_g1_i1:34-840(-)